MKTYKFANGDLVIDQSQNLVMTDGVDEIRQSVEIGLSINWGEWFLNILYGLNYSAIMGKGKKIGNIEMAVRDAVLQEPRVDQIEFIEIKMNDKDRSLLIDFKFNTIEGETIELSEVIIIGQ